MPIRRRHLPGNGNRTLQRSGRYGRGPDSSGSRPRSRPRAPVQRPSCDRRRAGTAGRGCRFAPSEKSIRTVWSSTQLNDPGSPIVEMSQLVKPEDAAATAIYWYEPSPNGEFVVMTVTSHGAMVGEFRVVETATGRVLPISIPTAAYTGAIRAGCPMRAGSITTIVPRTAVTGCDSSRSSRASNHGPTPCSSFRMCPRTYQV